MDQSPAVEIREQGSEGIVNGNGTGGNQNVSAFRILLNYHVDSFQHATADLFNGFHAWIHQGYPLGDFRGSEMLFENLKTAIRSIDGFKQRIEHVNVMSALEDPVAHFTEIRVLLKWEIAVSAALQYQSSGIVLPFQIATVGSSKDCSF